MKLKELMPAAEQKNTEIVKINSKFVEEMREANVLMGKYATQIKQEYI
mgnify:CR=1 FL=1